MSKLQRLAAVLVALALALATFSIPGAGYAANGYLEDCDFDGYDDETHAPVPWYGFDGTKGDKVPGDWDGVAGSYVFKMPGSGTGNSTGSGSTSGSDSKTSSSSSTSKSSSTKSASSSAKSAASSSASTSGSTSASGVAGESGGALETVDAGAAQTDLSDEAAAIVKIVGSLHVAPVVGENFEPGSTVSILGYFFAADVHDLDIYLISDESEILASANTSRDGSFATEAKLPESLEPGDYSIVIAYQGVAIVKRSIEVVGALVTAEQTGVEPAGTEPIADGQVPLAAESEPTAQSGLVNPVGVAILAALAALCIATLLIWKARGHWAPQQSTSRA